MIEMRGKGEARLSSAAFRHELGRRRMFSTAVLGALLILLLVVGTLTLLPGASWAGGGSASGRPGGNLTVTLGVSRVTTTECSDGQLTSVEGVPWENASAPVSTGDVHLELVELIDGDVDGGAIAPPTVTAASLCGSPLVSGWPSWYAVLQGPAGENEAYFSYSQYWVDLAHPGEPNPILPGSSLILVSTQSFAHLSFGLCVLGSASYPTLDTCARL